MPTFQPLKAGMLKSRKRLYKLGFVPVSTGDHVLYLCGDGHLVVSTVQFKVVKLRCIKCQKVSLFHPVRKDRTLPAIPCNHSR